MPKKAKEEKSKPRKCYTVSLAGELLGPAQQAAERAKAGDVQNAGKIAVVFCAACLEAFINDVLFHADRVTPATEVGRKEAAILSELGRKAIEGRATTEEKYNLLSLLERGKHWEWGCKHWQQYGILINVRNELIHCKKPEAVVKDDLTGSNSILRSKTINALVSDRLVDGEAAREMKTWPQLIDTLKIVEWAIQVVKDVSEDVNALLRERGARLFRQDHPEAKP